MAKQDKGQVQDVQVQDKLTYSVAVAALVAALQDTQDAQVKAALDVVRAGRGGGRVAQEKPFLAAFVDVGQTVHEDAVFATYKLGRRDAYWTIADAVKNAKDPNTRKWIQFDAATGLYTYMGIGATPPAGYTGYVPVAMRQVAKA
jgi:hypothetical protein